MPSKISWKFEFIGLDVALVKLREIDRLLSRISSRRAGSILGPSGGQVSPNAVRGGTSATTAGVAGAVGGATLGSAGAVAGQTVGSTLATSAALIRLQRSFGNRIMMPSSFMKELLETGYATIKRPSSSPSPKDTEESINWMKSGAHLLRGTSLSRQAQAFVSLEKLPGPLKAVGVAAIALMVAFKSLSEAIRHGAMVFQQAAASGVGISRSNKLREALKSIGINEEPTMMMNLSRTPQGVMGAAMASGFGSTQQLMNMADKFNQAMSDAASSSDKIADSAGAMQGLSREWAGVTREFKTLLVEIAHALEPILYGLLNSVKNLFRFISGMVDSWNKIMNFLFPTIFPRSKPGEKLFPGGMGGGGGAGMTSWEKIGFTFASGGPTEDIRQTAKNTGEIVKELKTLNAFIGAGKGITAGALGGMGGFLP